MNHYDLLKTIPRNTNRKIINMNHINLPFFGGDVWTLYELSWLNKNGLPQIAVARIEIDATSINIVESKSLKIYINSFNQIKFDNREVLIEKLQLDLKKCTIGNVSVNLFNLDEIRNQKISVFNGYCIDKKNIHIQDYEYNKLLLMNSHEKKIIEESLYSDLFKSNCPITAQPDWASIQILYTGQAIDHNGLLRYLVSFRNYNGFHEECIEIIFNDIKTICKTKKLSIYARYTRRGGIDINPWRSDNIFNPCLIRMARQ